ncbi:MAG: helix-turn-helix transcriptional regulator [Planctomycetaceae bacterium]|nr:helix-turn-helix transcriptional regulator [Planctomycetaceae bacterium]
MGRIPEELRQTIAQNIRTCRMNKFPGRGGAKLCAQAFGVSPQQWSPWERGLRIPDETRLRKIAEFFGVDVDYLRKNHGNVQVTPPPPPASAAVSKQPTPSEMEGVLTTPEFLDKLYRHRLQAVYRVEVTVTSVTYEQIR